MNLLHIQSKITTSKPDSLRHLSVTLARNGKKKNSCQETDCCGKQIYVQPKSTIYIERSCQPCSFFTWKPKIPILQSAPPLVGGRSNPSKKKQCFAGMKLVEKCFAEVKREAAECQKQCGAKPVCPPPPPPPEAVKEKPVCDELQIPAPDWDCSWGQKKTPKDECEKYKR